jgi:DNA-binding LacI/PurR family transcriptional regulator
MLGVDRDHKRRHLPRATAPSDKYAGAVATTRHLLDLGQRTVWHVAGPPDWLEAQLRIDGWRATLEAAGAEAPPTFVGD